VSRVPPDSKAIIAKLAISFFIFSLVWMFMRLSEGLLRLYLPQIRQRIAKSKAPQPPTALLFNGIRVILIALGLLALFSIWNVADASGIIVLATVVIMTGLVLRDALARIPRKIHVSRSTRNRLVSTGKLFLILMTIAGFVELARRGYLILARQDTSNANIMIFLLVAGLLILFVSTLRSRRLRWRNPSFKAVLLPMLAIVLVCAFAGIEPLASYKDTAIKLIGQGWQFITSTTMRDVTSAVAKAEPAVVRLETERSTGSGMVIEKSGYVLTCNHVVRDAQSARILFISGEEYPGSVIARDESMDIAILRVTGGVSDHPVVVLGNSDRVRPGEDVVAVGYSLGLEGKATISRGVVSALRTSDDVDYIQTDAAINPGNSGGPLINLRGEVIGIANFKFVGEAVEGMGFAVAINNCKPFIIRVIAEEQARQQAEREEQALLELEREILRLINVERQERGISPIVWDDLLHDGARIHSQNMQARGYLYHDTHGMFAECCYGASSVSSIYATAQATVQAWMSSTAGHREILLDARYRRGAVGVARDTGFWATYRCY